MSVLTKIFVFLVTILSVMLVAVVVTFVANQENMRDKFDAEKGERLLAVASANHKQAAMEAHEENNATQRSELNGKITKLHLLLQDKSDEAANLKAENIGLRRDELAIDARNAELSASSHILSSTVGQIRQELLVIRGALDTSRDRLIRTEDALAEKSTQVDILQRELRFKKEELQENIRAYTSIVAMIEARGISLEEETSEETPAPSDAQIVGAITAVKEVGDKTYVQLNVGSNDGVVSNMRMLVHEDSHYKGNLVVNLVDPESSSGMMTLVQEAVRVGDQILSD